MAETREWKSIQEYTDQSESLLEFKNLALDFTLSLDTELTLVFEQQPDMEWINDQPIQEICQEKHLKILLKILQCNQAAISYIVSWRILNIAHIIRQCARIRTGYNEKYKKIPTAMFRIMNKDSEPEKDTNMINWFNTFIKKHLKQYFAINIPSKYTTEVQDKCKNWSDKEMPVPLSELQRFAMHTAFKRDSGGHEEDSQWNVGYWSYCTFTFHYGADLIMWKYLKKQLQEDVGLTATHFTILYHHIRNLMLPMITPKWSGHTQILTVKYIHIYK